MISRVIRKYYEWKIEKVSKEKGKLLDLHIRYSNNIKKYQEKGDNKSGEIIHIALFANSGEISRLCSKINKLELKLKEA